MISYFKNFIHQKIVNKHKIIVISWMMAVSRRKSFESTTGLRLTGISKMNDWPMSIFTSRWSANRTYPPVQFAWCLCTQQSCTAHRYLDSTSTIQLGWQLTLYQHLLLDRCLTARLPRLLAEYSITQHTWTIPLILSRTRHFRFTQIPEAYVFNRDHERLM